MMLLYYIVIPLKIHMEHNNGALEDDFPLQMRVNSAFSLSSFSGGVALVSPFAVSIVND